MNSFLAVFRGITNAEGYKKIGDSDKLWLIRESASCIGMISIDFLNKKNNLFESYRFAYLPEEGWIIAHGHSIITKVKGNIEKIVFSNKSFAIRIEGLLEKVQVMFGLSVDDLLVPKEFEASPNYAYSVVHDESKEKTELDNMCCPILGESLKDCRRVGILNGRFYDYDSIMRWVEIKGTDPLTRQRVGVTNIRESKLFTLN